MTPLTVAQDALCMGLVLLFLWVVAKVVVEFAVFVWNALRGPSRPC